MFSEAQYNPVGSYIKYFDLNRSMCGKRIHICFEGVEEAMYLWLNGQFIGLSLIHIYVCRYGTDQRCRQRLQNSVLTVCSML